MVFLTFETENRSEDPNPPNEWCPPPPTAAPAAMAEAAEASVI